MCVLSELFSFVIWGRASWIPVLFKKNQRSKCPSSVLSGEGELQQFLGLFFLLPLYVLWVP
jgi:hypothetical protein